MSNPSGLSFSESLAGYLSEGEDFWDACRAGRDLGQAARFWVTVTIPDLDAFMDDPEHVAAMTGRLRVAGLGAARVKEGRIHLFCKRDGQTRLLYHLPFKLGEEPYLLRGEKRLRRAGGLEVWRQMTTLYAELLRGDGTNGDKPLRRGIMRIGPEQVALQGLSFRSIDAGNPAAAVRNIARFLSFSSSQRAR
jgi:cholesterol oxidase